LDFGECFPGESKTQVIKIHNTTEHIFEISQIDSTPGVSVKIEPGTLYPADYGQITVQMTANNRDFGLFNDKITFNIEYEDSYTQSGVYLTANIMEDFSSLTPTELANAPRISISTDMMKLQNLEPGESRTENIEIENTGKSDLHIRNIQVTESSFSVFPKRFMINPGKKASFEIKVIPGNIESKLKTMLTIISNDPQQSVINITIVAEVNLPNEKVEDNNVILTKVLKAKSLISSFHGDDDFVILDVRTEKEYEHGCIEDAVNIDYESADFENIVKLLDTEKTYLVYCKSGYRSEKAVNLMSEMGLKKIYHMYEGFDGWKAQKFKLVDPLKDKE
jgi:rhodanese-related sulfurtransferase